MRTLKFSMKKPHQLRLAGMMAFVFVWLCGCATPVGVSRVNEKIVYQQIDKSALTENSYSSYTAVVMHRHGLNNDDFMNNPGELIRSLHQIAVSDGRRDLLLSLSELCFLTGKKAHAAQEAAEIDHQIRFFDSPAVVESIDPFLAINSQMFYRASVIYAYLFLLGPGNEPPPGPFDRRFRLACDLYNRSLAKLLSFADGRLAFTDRIAPLPAGNIHLTVKTIQMPWDPNEVETIFPADTFEIHGLSVRNRIPGMGAPVVAVRKKTPQMPVSATSSATVFLEVKGSLDDLTTGKCRGEISVYSNFSGNEIMVGNRQVPLETDLTAPIAYSLNDPVLWAMGRNLFRFGRSLFEPGIYPTQPYRPGQIPVVLVHGTMSSMVWWSEMLNTLRSDALIREHYQIWFYLYDSGKPVIFSAVHLRDAIEKKIKELDPDGLDPALKNIVVVGHSQGGLLARFTAIDTGDLLVKTVLGKPLDELDISERDKELISRYVVIQPIPEVRRVVFIATPHRGSILAGSLARRLAMRLITLPRDVVQTGNSLLHVTERFSAVGKLKWSLERTSIDSMSPDNPSLLAIAELPFPQNIRGHSIIAIKGNNTPPDGDDGVVAYRSAHINGVESELVVPYGHSCQMEPLVIEEVRRILIEHLTDSTLAKTE